MFPTRHGSEVPLDVIVTEWMDGPTRYCVYDGSIRRRVPLHFILTSWEVFALPPARVSSAYARLFVQMLTVYSMLTWGAHKEPPVDVPKCGFSDELCPPPKQGKLRTRLGDG